MVGSGEAELTLTEYARQVGRLVAQREWVLVTGGRDAGIMKSAIEGAKEVQGSITVGILPDSAVEACQSLDVRVISGVGEARNNIIVLTADAVVACGVRDPGTASEVALAIKAEKPVVLIEPCAATIAFLNHLGATVHVAESPMSAICLIERLLAQEEKARVSTSPGQCDR